MTKYATTEDWRSPILEFITHGIVPADRMAARKLWQKAAWFLVEGDDLYRRTLSEGELLRRCVTREEGMAVVVSAHQGTGDDVRFLPEVVDSQVPTCIEWAADSACPEAPVCSNRALRDAQSTACGRGITLYAPNSANQSFSVVKYRSLSQVDLGSYLYC